jgi:hypothetical protein
MAMKSASLSTICRASKNDRIIAALGSGSSSRRPRASAMAFSSPHLNRNSAMAVAVDQALCVNPHLGLGDDLANLDRAPADRAR